MSHQLPCTLYYCQCRSSLLISMFAKIKLKNFPRMVVTTAGQGAYIARNLGNSHY